MYDWKEIALMYKSELDNLQDEVFECSETLKQATPHCHKEAIKILVGSLNKSEQNFTDIETFESMVKERKPKKERAGSLIQKEYRLSEKDKEDLSSYSWARGVDDYKMKTSLYASKYALWCSVDWLKEHGYDILDKDVMKTKKDSFSIVHKKNKSMRSVKVVWASRGIGGKANTLDGSLIGTLSNQHYYLVDLDKTRHDIYIFCNYSQTNENMIVYAWVKGKYIDKMIIEPLRKRYKGKKGCIIEKESLTGKNFPCSIFELLHRDEHGLREEGRKS